MPQWRELARTALTTPGAMRLANALPGTSRLISRHVVDETLPEAIALARELATDGFDLLFVDVDATLSRCYPDALAMIEAVDAVRRAGLGRRSALVLGGCDLDDAALVGAAARAAGMRLLLDDPDPQALLGAIAPTGADVAPVVHVRRRDAEERLAVLLDSGVVSLVLSDAPVPAGETVWESAQKVDLCFVRCLCTALDANVRLTVSTDSSTIIAIAQDQTVLRHRDLSEVEFLVHGGPGRGLIRPLIGAGRRVRIRVPYGRDGYGYTVQRMLTQRRLPRPRLSVARA